MCYTGTGAPFEIGLAGPGVIEIRTLYFDEAIFATGLEDAWRPPLLETEKWLGGISAELLGGRVAGLVRFLIS